MAPEPDGPDVQGLGVDLAPVAVCRELLEGHRWVRLGLPHDRQPGTPVLAAAARFWNCGGSALGQKCAFRARDQAGGSQATTHQKPLTRVQALAKVALAHSKRVRAKQQDVAAAAKDGGQAEAGTVPATLPAPSSK